MALLSDFPSIPPPDELSSLRKLVSLRLVNQPFFKQLPILPHPHGPIAPYLGLAFACLAYAVCLRTPDSKELANSMFLAGVKLWAVMLEVDNREARTIDSLIAGLMLSQYGFLTSERCHWDRSELLLCASATIARRLRLFGNSQAGGTFPAQLSTKGNSHGALTSSLFLLDVVCALHTDAGSNISSRELWIKMLASDHHFQDVYSTLLSPTGELPSDIVSQEDALLLLCALLSDAIYVRRSLADLSYIAMKTVDQQTQRGGKTALRNPFVPFSPHAEYARMMDRISHALDTWYRRFCSIVDSNTLALYYFCQLYRSCSQISKLLSVAAYKPFNRRTGFKTPSQLLQEQSAKISISEDSVKYAWLVLDHTTSSEPATNAICPIWLPVALFYASLVVWAKVKLTEKQEFHRHGSVKSLLAFKLELGKMPWPCCKDMALTLDSLMAA